MSIAVVLAIPDIDDEPLIVAALEDSSAGISIARRCVDAIDLVGALSHSQCSAAVISPGLPRLGSSLLEQIIHRDIALIGVVSPGDSRGAAFLDELGISPIIVLPEADASGAAVAIAQAAHQADRSPIPLTVPPEPLGDRGEAEGPMVLPESSHAGLIVVWGPTGSPGRTSIAIGLADEITRMNEPVLLIDADVYGASIPLSLGVWEEASGLAIACRQAASSDFDAAALAQCARSLNEHWRILTGVQRVQRAGELGGRALARLWEVCRTLPGYVLVDIGPIIDMDEDWSADRHQPRPGYVARSALDAADLVVVVGSADPIGMNRLGQGLGDLARLRPDPPMIAVTQVRSSVLGRRPHHQVCQVLAEHASLGPATLIDDDRAAYDMALRDGRTLAEAAPRSRARAGVRELAQQLTAARMAVTAP